jgi:hypothetical protein
LDLRGVVTPFLEEKHHHGTTSPCYANLIWLSMNLGVDIVERVSQERCPQRISDLSALLTLLRGCSECPVPAYSVEKVAIIGPLLVDSISPLIWEIARHPSCLMNLTVPVRSWNTAQHKSDMQCWAVTEVGPFPSWS